MLRSLLRPWRGSCSVDHTSVLTGLIPASHGVLNDGVHSVPEEVTTPADRLGDRATSTAAFVSAAVLERRYNLDQGFHVCDVGPTLRLRPLSAEPRSGAASGERSKRAGSTPPPGGSRAWSYGSRALGTDHAPVD